MTFQSERDIRFNNEKIKFQQMKNFFENSKKSKDSSAKYTSIENNLSQNSNSKNDQLSNQYLTANSYSKYNSNCLFSN